MCGNSRTNDPPVGFHHFPSAQKNPERRALWPSVFGKTEEDVTFNSRVCSRHFPSGNVELSPVSTVGKRFASPIKKGVRAERAKQRQEQNNYESSPRLQPPHHPVARLRRSPGQ